MRYLYLLLLLVLGGQVARGQTSGDTLPADTLPHEIEAESVTRRVVSYTDSAGQCVETLNWSGAIGLMRIYYPSGHLKEYVPYADLGADKIHGLVTTWYENGQLESQQPFIQGKREGKLLLYYDNGQLKRLSDYIAGAEQLGRCFDIAGIAVPFFPYEQPPLYPGGQMQLAKEIDRAIRWPRDVPALLGVEERTVYVSFVVGKDGSIRSPQVAMSSHIPSLDRAVLATIQKLTRRFTPARRDGLIVQSKYYIPIRFDGMPYTGHPQKN
jgi:protein TonB